MEPNRKRRRVATLESKFKSLLSTLWGYEDDELVSDLEGLLRKAEVCVARCQNRKRRAEEAEAKEEKEEGRTTKATEVDRRAKRQGVRGGRGIIRSRFDTNDGNGKMEANKKEWEVVDNTDDEKEEGTAKGSTRMTHDAKGHRNAHRSSSLPRHIDSDDEVNVYDDDRSALGVNGKFKGMSI